MMDYYDLILGGIPLTVAGVAGLLTTLGFGLSVAVAAGSLVTLPLIGHAMFVRAPVPGTTTEEPTQPSSSTQSQAGMGTAD